MKRNWQEMWPLHGRAGAALAYAAAAAISTVAAVILLDLRSADLHVPFDYGGDALFGSLIVKSVLDHGWFWTNPSVGAPGALDLYAFPATADDSAHLLFIKAMSIFSRDWALLVNLYFLLGFPLITLSAMATIRQFRVGYGPAMVASVLYSFLPSRLLKGEGHLFLDVFYQVPLAIMVLLWVCSESPPLTRDRGKGRWPGLDWRRSRSWGSLLIAGLVSSTTLYYAFFTAVLLAVGSIWASLIRRSMRNVIAGLALVGIIVAGLGANALPSILYQVRHGHSHPIFERESREAEAYGMKIAQLLLPVQGHRVPVFEAITRHYELTAPLVGENGTTSLGIVGDAGFVVLLAVLVAGRRSERREDDVFWPLGVLNLMAVLLGTVGGFGSLFAYLVSPQIRTYSRLNVLIGFFALFAVALLLDRLVRRRPRLGICALAVILVVGLLDQTNPAMVRRYADTKREYASDADIVRRIESTIPAGSAILDLPYMDFPEPGPVHHMWGYEPIRPYLHSRGLRWSYPAMKGGEGDAWLRDVSGRTPDRMLESLTNAGFGGVLVDRNGYPDNGCGIESAFRMALGTPPVVSPSGRRVFFDLAACAGGGCQTCGAPGRPCCNGVDCRGGARCNQGDCECGRLASGQTLANGQTMVSCDGRFSLTMQDDGDLVLRGCGCAGDGGSCWSSRSSGHAGADLVMQGDGNLVVFGAGCNGPKSSCWSSNTVGHAGASLTLQTDGKLCVYAGECAGPNGACWCSNPSPSP